MFFRTILLAVTFFILDIHFMEARVFYLDSSESVLPFPIDSSKKMPDFELVNKKQGMYITGIPRFEFDPIRGIGIGAGVQLYQNGAVSDPFFPYTAYRHRLNAEFFIFENGRIRYAFNYDAPYIFNSRWRIRADWVSWEDPHAQYWGIGRQDMKNLQFRDKRGGGDRFFSKVKDYENNLALAEQTPNGWVNDYHFHHISQREQLYNILAERVMMGGKIRFLFGYEALFTSFSSYQGMEAEKAFSLEGENVIAINNPTLVDLQRKDGTWDTFNLKGFGDAGETYFTSMLAAALLYDTRDFEPDPSKGVFLQYSHEFSSPVLGSDFSFHKFMLQGQYIKSLWKNAKGNRRLTFAGLGAFGHIFGSAINFIEMWDLSSQAEAGGILVLGGSRSLRGYREARFLAPSVALVNLELRSRLYDFKIRKEHISMGLTPFLDLGSVWDKPADVGFKGWRYSSGLGLRMAWNQSTILRLDMASSPEGSQVFFGFGHIF